MRPEAQPAASVMRRRSGIGVGSAQGLLDEGAPVSPSAFAAPLPSVPICGELDAEVAAFRDRDLSQQAYPYVFLDATYCKARVNHRLVSQAGVFATGVRTDGWREVLGSACTRPL